VQLLVFVTLLLFYVEKKRNLNLPSAKPTHTGVRKALANDGQSPSSPVTRTRKSEAFSMKFAFGERNHFVMKYAKAYEIFASQMLWRILFLIFRKKNISSKLVLDFIVHSTISLNY
jgi:hypothetical protein